MRQRTRLAALGATLAAATVSSVALPGPALAAKPHHAGPGTKTTVPLAEGAPTFICDGRHISVTGGEFMDRFRELPGGRFLSQTVALRGTGVDEQGDAYKIRVSGRFTGSESHFEGRFNVVLIGQGDVYRVQFRFSADDGEEITGDCEVVW